MEILKIEEGKGERALSISEDPIKTAHRFSDCIYWNLFILIPAKESGGGKITGDTVERSLSAVSSEDLQACEYEANTRAHPPFLSSSMEPNPNAPFLKGRGGIFRHVDMLSSLAIYVSPKLRTSDKVSAKWGSRYEP